VTVRSLCPRVNRWPRPSPQGGIDIDPGTHAEGREGWRALELLVNDLSRRAAAAKWLGDAEFDVWRLVTEGGRWGRVTSGDSTDQLSEALTISSKLGIWVGMDDETGFVKPIPIEAWLRSYERWRAGISPER
jgi:hypothetical protein